MANATCISLWENKDSYVALQYLLTHSNSCMTHYFYFLENGDDGKNTYYVHEKWNHDFEDVQIMKCNVW